jgi:CRP/FNR family transcriptional regulator, cyclic AMP receptor protein
MMSPAGINVLTHNMPIKEFLAAARLTLYATAHRCPAMTPYFPTPGTVKGGFMRKVSGLANTKSQEKKGTFDVQAFLDSTGVSRKVEEFRRNETIFRQGDPCENVLYVRKGTVRLSVVNEVGKEAVVAVLGPGDFFGEGCLTGLPFRAATATAITPTSALAIEKNEMIRVLRTEHALSDRFISYMLGRNIQVEEDLVDQLFNSSEKRLARTLLMLARYSKRAEPQKILPKVSQEMLAKMIGTTRSRVNFFMNKFRKLGFIRYNGGLHVDSSLLTVVLHE